MNSMYVAQPRRIRRNLRRYLSTWVDWKSSKLGEGLTDFRARALKDTENDGEQLQGNVLPWVLHESSSWGVIRGTKRWKLSRSASSRSRNKVGAGGNPYG
jgi:hypothetical protein